MGGEPTTGTPVGGTRECTDRRWVRWCAVDCVGVAPAGAAAVLAVMSLVAGTGDDDSSYSSVRIPIAATIFVASVIVVVLILAGEYVRRPVPGSLRGGALWGSPASLFIAVVILGTCGLFMADEFHGLAHSRAVLSFWLLAFGVLVVAVTYPARREHTRLLGAAGFIMPAWAWLLPVTTVLVVIGTVGVVTVRPWQTGEVVDKATVVGPRDPVVELGDLRPVSATIPSSVLGTSTVLGPSRGSGMIAVGPGYLAGRTVMVNADNSIRWKLALPESMERALVMVMPRQRTILVVPNSGRADHYPVDASDHDVVAIDADSGAVRWRSHMPDWVWDLRDPERKSTEDLEGTALRVDGDVAIATSWDGRLLRAVSLADGSELWRHNVGRNCAVADVLSGPDRVTAHLSCGVTGFTAKDFDATTGRLLGAGADFIAELAVTRPRIVARYRGGRDGEHPRRKNVSALVDAASGSVIADLEGRSIVSCTTDQCLLEDYGAGSRHYLVSLVAPYREVTVADESLNPWDENAVWLRDQLVWTEYASGPGRRIIILDRRTGKTVLQRDGADFGSVVVVPGGILVDDGGRLLRFPGAGR